MGSPARFTTASQPGKSRKPSSLREERETKPWPASRKAIASLLPTKPDAPVNPIFKESPIYPRLQNTAKHERPAAGYDMMKLESIAGSDYRTFGPLFGAQ